MVKVKCSYGGRDVDILSGKKFPVFVEPNDVHSSAVVLKGVYLNWKEANEACRLIKFSQLKTEYKTFIDDMVVEHTKTPNSGYWIQDAVTEFSVVNKGCQKNVNVLGSTTIENNRLLNCFQFCQNKANTTTIGVKGNNCSCLASLTSDTYLSIDNCDIPCVWEDRLCEMATVFSVFERQDSFDELSGFRIEECISVNSGRAEKLIIYHLMKTTNAYVGPYLGIGLAEDSFIKSKRRRNNSRSAYHSPIVEYATQQRRDSKQSQTRSVKSSPLKPVRRSKKANPDSLVSGTEYENIVLTFEDPSTISRVVSSTSTDKTEIPKEEENYDVMNAENKTTSSNLISQNVYGFSPPEGEYDVMNRENRNVDEFNPDYDHM
uniref:WSC domain-containing protein n=1 Tax=Magallana gigas TaxID=29159 RepID=K1QAC2_MAGGI